MIWKLFIPGTLYQQDTEIPNVSKLKNSFNLNLNIKTFHSMFIIQARYLLHLLFSIIIFIVHNFFQSTLKRTEKEIVRRVFLCYFSYEKIRTRHFFSICHLRKRSCYSCYIKLSNTSKIVLVEIFLSENPIFLASKETSFRRNSASIT